ncbi:PRC-barrel domain-containing protein [Aquabacter sp. CN5-332]|uniref:PRC-barrel domain-containing protein n=1 Tax=Aquabacter sp. CN5-332 TaxID=3156608 RepID=UPI0032B4819E
MEYQDETTALIASGKVKGTDVYNTEGEHIGIVHDLMVDKQTGRITSAILSIGSILGMGGEHQPVPWNSLKYDTQQKGYVLGIPLAQMQDAPEEPEEEWPVPAAGRVT